MKTEVKFYSYSARPDLIPKENLLQYKFSYPALEFITGERPLLDMVIELRWATEVQSRYSLEGINYVSFTSPVETPSRVYYYFINNVSLFQGILTLNLHMDVLGTYKDEIFELNVVLERAPEAWVNNGEIRLLFITTLYCKTP